MKVIIYTDGSSRGNPGRGGWSAIIMTDKHVMEFGGREDMTTNNRMELFAAIKGLQGVESLKSKVESDIKEVELHTDSQYVKKGMSEWIAGWVKRDWKGSNKKIVLNKDLWQELLKQETKLKEKKIKVVWKYVKGHAGIDGNERADVIATEFADLPIRQAGDNDFQLYNGSRAKYHF